LAGLHNQAIQSGLADCSPSYFQHLETSLAALHSERPAAAANHLVDEMQQRSAAQNGTQQQQPEQRPRTNIVSAPVSRAVPSASGQRQNGKITLSLVEQEAARIAGVSLEEYAKQKKKLMEMQASGEYSDRR
jgi:hypothetical protein